MTANHFRCLALPEAYDLDPAELERAYFATQRRWHPDRFIGKPPLERMQAMQASASANEAYRTLKDPLWRAQHLLALHGVQVNGEQDTVKPAQSLLIEIMERREAFDEADDADRPALRVAIDADKHACTEALAVALRNEAWQDAGQLAIRLRYLQTLAGGH